MPEVDPDDGQPLLMPVGLYLGPFYRQPGVNEHVHQVRRATTVHRLDDAELAVWAMAHGVPDALVDTPWTRTVVQERVTALGVQEPARLVDDLLDRGLLVEVAGSADATDFARTHNLVPRMLGLGNTAEAPGVFSVGLTGEPLVGVAPAVYDLWKFSHLDPSLWVGCTGAAEMAERAGVRDQEQTDPQQLLEGVLDMVHVLLAVNAAAFDAVPDVDDGDTDAEDEGAGTTSEGADA